MFGFRKEYKYYIVDNTDRNFDFKLGEIVRVVRENKSLYLYSIFDKRTESACGNSRFKYLKFIKKNCSLLCDLEYYPIVLEDIKEFNKYRLDYNDKRMGYLKALNLANERLDEIINEKGENILLNRFENNCGMCSRRKKLSYFFFVDLDGYPCPFDTDSKDFLKDSKVFNEIDTNKEYNCYSCYKRCKLSKLTAKEAKKILNDTEKVVKEAMLKEKRL